jgi:hypothetical protein
MKRYLRKNELAERYGVTPRNIDYMVKDGRIPAPFYRGRFPLWDPDQVDAADRAALVASRPPRRKRAAPKIERTEITA